MKQVLVVFIILQVTFYSQAQTLKGVVLEGQSKQPIGYVSIGIINTPIGTYANENGQFELTLESLSETDSIRFSCIGFNSVTFNAIKFVRKAGNLHDTIYLSEKFFELGEVVIYGEKAKKIILGNRYATGFVKIGIFEDREPGTIIENDKKILLESVSFKLTMAKYQEPDSAIFRFNIYSLKDNLPHENILNKPIYFHLKKGQFHSVKSTFDISEHKIQLDDNFAATFELVRQYGGRRIYFTGKVYGCKSITRRGQQGEWREVRTEGSPVSLHQSIEIEAKVLE